jgi:peroxiredoxin Q/BCP
MRSIVFSLMFTAGVAGSLAAQAQEQPASRTSQPVARIVSGPGSGDMAPNFRLPWASADSIGSMSDDFILQRHMGEVVVVAFYPKDFTSGCTAEMKAFAERYQELFGDAVVVGISADSLESHRRFAASLDLPFRLLSDPNQRVARLYGSNGESYPRRTVFVINREGRVTYRDMRFGALDATAYDKLKAAVQAAAKG